VDSPRLHDLIAPDAELEQLATGFIFTEGPIWSAQERALYFSDMPGDVFRRYSDDDGVREIWNPADKSNGNTYDREGRLLTCHHSTSSVVRTDADGTRTTIASHYEGKELNSPNDVVVKSDGSIYFTDPPYGRWPGFGVEREQELDFCGVFRIAPDGSLRLLVDDFAKPNGLCFTADERLLYINDTDRAHIRLFDVDDDGGLSNGRLFFEGIGSGVIEEGIPDGMKLDEHGNVYVTGPRGVWVISPEGEKLGELEVPENVGNHHWGGPGWSQLYICASSSIYRVQTKTSGRREPFMR
jgi:gluconolactonase